MAQMRFTDLAIRNLKLPKADKIDHDTAGAGVFDRDNLLTKLGIGRWPETELAPPAVNVRPNPASGGPQFSD